MKFNEDKAMEFAKKILPMFERKDPPFDAQSCESILPEGVTQRSLEHAMFLFYASIGNAAVDSDTYYSQARTFYRERTDCFDPKNIINQFTTDADESSNMIKIVGGKSVTVSNELIEILKQHQGGKFKELAKRIWNNSVELEKYNFDPRNMFGPKETIASIIKKMDGYKHRRTKVQHGFRGLKQKIGNMLINQYIEADIAQVKDPENARIPVDFHIIDRSVAFNIIELDRDYRDYEIVEPLQQKYSGFFRAKKVDALAFSKAMWMLGKYGCSKNMCNEGCEIETKCKKQINSSAYFDKGNIVVESR